MKANYTAYTRVCNVERGFEIRFARRRKTFLVIMTNFNPFNFFDFWDKIDKVDQIEEFKSIHKYPDGSGYVIFSLSKNNDIQIINESLINSFIAYFE